MTLLLLARQVRRAFRAFRALLVLLVLRVLRVLLDLQVLVLLAQLVLLARFRLLPALQVQLELLQQQHTHVQALQLPLAKQHLLLPTQLDTSKFI
jgi:hypothetical protein